MSSTSRKRPTNTYFVQKAVYKVPCYFLKEKMVAYMLQFGESVSACHNSIQEGIGVGHHIRQ